MENLENETVIEEGRIVKRLSNSDLDFIRKNYEKLTLKQIADVIKRPVKTVEATVKRLKLNLSVEERYLINAQTDLKNSIYWKDVKLQFNEQEQELFLNHWSSLIDQFKEVPHTEKLQIMDLIKVTVLMERSLKEEQQQTATVARIRSQIIEQRQKPLTEQDVTFIMQLERDATLAVQSQLSFGSRYQDLLKQKESILKNLKATREQRVKRLEDAKENFTAWIKNLMGDPELRYNLGLQMEKMRMAANIEENRLSKLHTYADGSVDQPLFNEETVGLVKDEGI